MIATQSPAQSTESLVARGAPVPPWAPLAGSALLDRLRLTGRARPVVDPSVAADLRSGLETGLAALGLHGGRLAVLEQHLALRWDPACPDPIGAFESNDPGCLVVTPDRLHAALQCHDHRPRPTTGPDRFSIGLAVGALIDALFRQIVTTGFIGNAMEDGLAALAVDEFHAPLVQWIEERSAADSAELVGEVERQAAGLVDRWPALDKSWLPRTKEVLRTGLAGGSVELVTCVDLMIGRPADRWGSVALVEVTSGSRRPEHRRRLHFGALIETLRTGAPPFAAATYYTQTGEIDVDPITVDVLVAAAGVVLSGLDAMVSGRFSRFHGRSASSPYRDTRPWSGTLSDGCPSCVIDRRAPIWRHTEQFVQNACDTSRPEGEGPR